MKEVRLYGFLRARFGASYRLDVANAGEAVRALGSVVKGFRAAVIDHKPGFRVSIGRENLTMETLDRPTGNEVIRIVPCVAGAKSEAAQILSGAALIALSAVTGMPVWLATGLRTVGMATTLGGVSRLLASPTDYVATGNLTSDDPPAYTFSGPQMTKGQGNPVPVLLGGPLRIGGALISMGSSPEAWQAKGLGGAAADDAGTLSASMNGDTVPFVWSIGEVI